MVVFVGGSFDTAEDLRKLNEEEMSSLWIVADDAHVILNNSVALAYGQMEQVDEIYNTWARFRQAKWPSQLLNKRFRKVMPFLSALFLSAALGFSVIAFLGIFSEVKVSGLDRGWPAANLLLTIACVVVGWVISANPGAGRSYAIIKPHSHEEDRKETRAEYIARRAWWAAVASATIAGVALLINLLAR